MFFSPKSELPRIEKPSSTIVNINKKKPASVEAEEMTSDRIESFLLNFKN